MKDGSDISGVDNVQQAASIFVNAIEELNI